MHGELMEVIVNPTEEQTRCMFVKAIKEMAVALTEEYSRNVKIEINVPADGDINKVKVHLTEYDL